jgi:hypothetical protein
VCVCVFVCVCVCVCVRERCFLTGLLFLELIAILAHVGWNLCLVICLCLFVVLLGLLRKLPRATRERGKHSVRNVMRMSKEEKAGEKGGGEGGR